MMCEIDGRIKRLEERLVQVGLEQDEFDKVMTGWMKQKNKELDELRKQVVFLEDQHERIDEQGGGRGKGGRR